MTAGEVLRVLGVSRQTLVRYVKSGIIAVEKLPSGRYVYDDNSVYTFANQKNKRQTHTYTCISGGGSQNEIFQTQLKRGDELEDYCSQHDFRLSEMHTDVAQGDGLDERVELQRIIIAALDYKLERLVIYTRDDLTKTSFNFVVNLLKEHGCEVHMVYSDTVRY